MSIGKSKRAGSANRGGSGGGGYEQTNPDYDNEKLERLYQDYIAMEQQWRSTFLEGLTRYEQSYITKPHVREAHKNRI